MGKGVNLVILEGNLGQEPEIRTIPSGQKCAQLSVGTNTRSKKNDDGKWEDLPADWHRVIVWGPDADYISQANKGDRISVKGELRTRSWEQDGTKRYMTEVQTQMVKFWPKDGSQRQPRPGQGQQAPPPMGDDDIPF
jgi:single-strand DNA-binding protein